MNRFASRMRKEREEKDRNAVSKAGRNINYNEYMYKPEIPCVKVVVNKRETTSSCISYREYMYMPDRELGMSTSSRKCSDETIAELSRKAREEEDSEVNCEKIAKRINVSRNEQNTSKKRKMRKRDDELAEVKKNVIVQRTDGSLEIEESNPVVMAKSRTEMDDMSATLVTLMKVKELVGGRSIEGIESGRG